MKTKIQVLTIVILIAYVNITNAQSSSGINTHSGIGTPFLGWNNTGPANPLDIKTEANQPMNFYTNAGTGTFNNQRMIITSVINKDSGYNFWFDI